MPVERPKLSWNDLTRIQRSRQQHFISAVTAWIAYGLRCRVADDPMKRQVQQRRRYKQIRHVEPAASPEEQAKEPGRCQPATTSHATLAGPLSRAASHTY